MERDLWRLVFSDEAELGSADTVAGVECLVLGEAAGIWKDSE